MDRIDTLLEPENERRYEGPCGDLAGAIATVFGGHGDTREGENILLKGGAVAPAAKSPVTDPNTGRQLSCWSLCLIFVKGKEVGEVREPLRHTGREKV